MEAFVVRRRAFTLFALMLALLLCMNTITAYSAAWAQEGPVDTDGDGQSDADEGTCGSDPGSAESKSLDTDADNSPDCVDPDDDGDGQTDADETACGSNPMDATSKAADQDGDKSPNCVDPDDDNDTVVDDSDADDDNDGQTDADETTCGSDPLDSTSKAADHDGDKSPNCVDADDDNDGVADTKDAFPLDKTESVDTDGDGLGNKFADIDDDNDHLRDVDEVKLSKTNPLKFDTDGDKIYDNHEDPELDGFTNGQEINHYGTNPLVFNSDDLGRIIVNSTSYRSDTDEDDGVCATGEKVTNALGKLVPECTLRAAVEAADDRPGPDVIKLPAGKYELEYGFDIYRDLTIAGAGASTTIIDGRYGSVFYIGDGAQVAISGVTIQGSEDGGIYNYDGDLTLTNSVVTGNTSYEGAGIYNEYGDVSLNATKVTGNTADYQGGGIYNYYGVVRIAKGTINGNALRYSYGYGAGIYNYEGKVLVSDSSVDRNTCAGCEGAGIYSEYGYARLLRATVSNNDDAATGFGSHATGTAGRYADYGGGIYAYEGRVDLISSVVAGNDTRDYGGGIYNEYASVTLDRSTVKSNTTDDDDGAGIYNEDGVLTLTNSHVTGNGGPEVVEGVDRADDGGGIYNEYGVLDWTGGTLSGNASSYSGGGLYNDDGNVTLTNVAVSNNTTYWDGGGIQNDGVLTFVGGSMTGNKGEQGGGLYNDDTAKVKNTTIGGNTAEEGGGVYNTGYGFRMVGSTVRGNKALEEGLNWEGKPEIGGGGGLYADDPATVVNSTLTGNWTDGEGGAFYNDDDLALTNVTVAANKADLATGGGGIYAYGDTTLKNTIVSGNTAAGLARNCAQAYPAEDWYDIDSAGHNLDSGATCGLDRGTDKSKVDPKLAALASNGGPTQTMALKLGSPAIDKASSLVCPVRDQRGVARVDGNGDGAVRCDIGAFEFKP